MVCVEDVGMGGDGWIEGWMSGRERDGVCRGCRDGG